MLVMSVTSCATMFSGTRADIFIDGDVDEPVSITSSAGVYRDVALPTFVEVKRRHLDGQHISIESEHHSFDDIVLQKTFNEWALGSVLISGTGFLIDLLTNAVSRPHYDQFFITPLDSMMQADSIRMDNPVLVSTMGPKAKALLKEKRLVGKYPRHEINVSVGVGSNQSDRSTKRFVDNIIQDRNMEADVECGNIFGDSYIMGIMEYHYRVNRMWDIGAIMAWGYSSESYSDEYFYSIEDNQLHHSDIFTYGYSKCRSFSLAPSVRYTWCDTGKYRLFSRVALGMMRHHLKFDTEQWEYGYSSQPYGRLLTGDRCDKIKWRMAYQLAPIGVSVGCGPLKFYAEMGYGCLGVCNLGLALCF